MKGQHESFCFGYCGSDDSKELISNDYLQINNCGMLRWEEFAPKDSKPRTRADYMLVYVCEGTCNYYADGHKLKLESGDLIYYPPETSINFVFNPYSLHYWIHFTGSAAEELMKLAGIKYNTVNKIGVIDNVKLLFSEIAFSISKKSEIEKLSINSNFLKILYIFAKQLNSKNQTPFLNEDHPVAIAKNIMLTEFWENHDADYYAKKSCCSISTFNHVFQELYHVTPKQYLRTLRIEHAKRLLLNSNLPIKDIALSSGYNDALYFCKVFKSVCKMSPTEYRNKYQK